MGREVLKGAKVELHLCNRHFHTKSKALVGPDDDPGESVKELKGEVFFKPPVTRAEAERLAKGLRALEYFDDKAAKTVQLLKEGKTFHTRFVVNPASIDKAAQVFRGVAGRLSKAVFHGQEVQVHLCDKSMKPIRSLPAEKSSPVQPLRPAPRP